MNQIQILIEQIVSDICSHVARSGTLRLYQFLEWLKLHSTKVKIVLSSDESAKEWKPIENSFHGRNALDEHFGNALNGWLESLPIHGLFWECRLILREIGWWRNLNQWTLARILKLDEG